MILLNKIYQFVHKHRLHEIESYATQPERVQLGQLQHLLSVSQQTLYGTKYGFESIKTIEQFRAQVPLQKYEDLYKHVELVRKGNPNVLWPGQVKWFAKSSGTTNDKSKYIPVTKESLYKCHFQGGRDVVALYLKNHPQSKILSGKTLTLGGSHQLDQFSEFAHSGDLSAIMLENIPIWANLVRTPPKSIVLVAEWEKKLEKLTQHVVKENVTALAGVPSWNMVMLKHLLHVTGKSNLLEIWPNMELFLHGGVNFLPYKTQYQKLIPTPAMHYMETYNASEGFFAIQDNPADASMLLMLDYGIFYEFIPMDSYYTGTHTTCTIGEVSIGVNYAVVISTNGGLWRYIIGDTVMFTSLYPHKIVITGRTRHFINAFGEEIIIENAEKALNEACQSTGAHINEYTAAPVYMGDNNKGAHEWLIEFNKEPYDIVRFADVLDKTLMLVNSDYDAKRYKNITLDKPIVRMLKKGTFYRWFSDKGKLGGQNKMPRLSNDRRYVDELLKYS